MAKIYVFNGGGYGHVYPTLGLVEELIRRGDEIIYYTTDELRPIVEYSGATFRLNPVAAPDEQTTSALHMASYFIRYSEMLLPSLIKAARVERPDYIIFDMFRVWGWHLSQYLNIPGICFSPSFITNKQVMQRVAPDYLQMFMNDQEQDDLKYREEYIRAAAAIKAQYGVNSPAPLDFFPVMGDLTLVHTARAFHPVADVLDSSIRFIGLYVGGRARDTSFPFERLRGRRVVFISLGTVFNQKTEFYQTCLRTFADSEYTVVLSIGKQVSVESLGEIPDNIIVRNFVPQLEVLQHADVFLTHGGMGSVNEALYYGVPMILYPQMFEQSLVTRQVEVHGAGIRLIPDSVRADGIRLIHNGADAAAMSAEELLGVVERVLRNPEYRYNAQRLGEELRRYSATEAADIVEDFVAQYSETSAASG
jgi:MGT family glycosyltransferase